MYGGGEKQPVSWPWGNESVASHGGRPAVLLHTAAGKSPTTDQPLSIHTHTHTHQAIPLRIINQYI